ncbi:Calcium-dependent protein kinase 24, partial [Mucuna pruriens]
MRNDEVVKGTFQAKHNGRHSKNLQLSNKGKVEGSLRKGKFFPSSHCQRINLAEKIVGIKHCCIYLLSSKHFNFFLFCCNLHIVPYKTTLPPFPPLEPLSATIPTNWEPQCHYPQLPLASIVTIKELGYGEFCMMHRMVDVENGEVFAFKKIAKTKLKIEIIVQDMEREAQIMRT